MAELPLSIIPTRDRTPHIWRRRTRDPRMGTSIHPRSMVLTGASKPGETRRRGRLYEDTPPIRSISAFFRHHRCPAERKIPNNRHKPTPGPRKPRIHAGKPVFRGPATQDIVGNRASNRQTRAGNGKFRKDLRRGSLSGQSVARLRARSVTNSLSWEVLALPLRGLLTLSHNPRVSGVVLFLIPTKRPDRLVVSPRRVSPGEEPRSRWRNGDRQSLEDEPEGRSPPGRTNVRRLEW